MAGLQGGGMLLSGCFLHSAAAAGAELPCPSVQASRSVRCGTAVGLEPQGSQQGQAPVFSPEAGTQEGSRGRHSAGVGTAGVFG